MRSLIISHCQLSVSLRAILASLTLSLLSVKVRQSALLQLKVYKHRVVCTGVAEVTITKWEEENTPYKLPDDFKAFLQISDGLSLNWKIKKNDMIFNLGQMHLNKLREIKRIKDEKFRFASMIDEDDSSDDETEDDAEER